MRNLMKQLVTLSAVAALAPAALGAQEAGSRIQATMTAAAEAGIPASLLESKVREGRAKGVAEARIASAVESRFDALVRARDAMREADLEVVTEGQLAVAADAVQAGVEEDVLVEVVRSAPEERRLVATAVLTSLVELGVQSAEARDRVTGALAAGPGALANLHAEVAAALRLGGGGVLPPLSATGAASGLVNIGG